MSLMNTPRMRFKLAILALACLGGIEQAQAQTCTVSATTMAFGTYDPKSNIASTTTGNVSVTCQATVSLLVSYSVKLGGGGGGSITARKMSTSGSQLSYQVYKDALLTQIWGDGTSGTSYYTGGYLLAVLVPVTTIYVAYGQISALQNVYAGSYTDTLTILVTY
jgi:spore coat protein U-like protein